MDNRELMKSALVEYLRTKIIESNYSYRRLSDLTGYSASKICKTMNGRCNLNSDLAVKLCEILHVSVDSFEKIFPEYINIKEEKEKTIEIYSFDLYNRINNLNEENKERVIKYIDFLLNKNILDIEKENINYNIDRAIKKRS